VKITLRPLTPGRWPDLEAVFMAKGCSVARGCWCMYYREQGKQSVPPGKTLREVRKQRLERLAASDPPPGLIAYRGATPVGWISLAPREQYLKLVNSPVMKAVDDRPVWSVICFVVPSEHRHQGVAAAMLDAAKVYARRKGAHILEAYPIDKPGRGSDDSMWHGAASMFDRAGFEVVARRKPHRPIVRLQLRK
jgi:GNAT superfamily N-acetyltransferase